MTPSLPVINQQKPELQFIRQDGSLEVVKVFPTIQGEGPFAGKPCTFVRLSGCNLDCPGCDTDYTSARKLYTPRELATLATHTLPSKSRLIVLTGGEPFRQNLTPFVEQVLNNGYQIQIETNGTLDLLGFPYHDGDVHIVCSPKTPKIAAAIALHCDAWKYILQAAQVCPEDGLPTSSLGYAFRPCRPVDSRRWQSEVYVQPMDEKDMERNFHNLQAAVGSCMKFGYRLSIQGHKIAGLE